MDKKKCFKCNQFKPLEEFYGHPKMKDRHLNKCIDCTKADVANHRAINIDKIHAYDRLRGGSAHRIKANKIYAQTPRGKAVKFRSCKAWRNRNLERYASHIILNNRIRSGEIVKPSNCSFCGSHDRIHGHHEDYSRPIDVIWLCQKCHNAIHKKDYNKYEKNRPISVDATHSHVIMVN